MSELEVRFEKELISIYNRGKKEIGYNATRFLQMIAEYGGVETAHKLIASRDDLSGFTILWENHKQNELSLESVVIKPEYQELFTEQEVNECRRRLNIYG